MAMIAAMEPKIAAKMGKAIEEEAKIRNKLTTARTIQDFSTMFKIRCFMLNSLILITCEILDLAVAGAASEASFKLFTSF